MHLQVAANPASALVAPLPMQGESRRHDGTPIPAGDAHPASIAPAISRDHQRACAALVRRMYTWRGYSASSPGLPASPNHVTFAAWQNGEVSATLSLSRDSGSGLLAEQLYPDEIPRLRHPGHVLCEATRLAVDPDCGDSRDLLLSLFRATYEYARAVFDATDIIIEVNPRHAGYYERVLGFVRVGKTRICPRVDAPAVLLHRSLTIPRQ